MHVPPRSSARPRRPAAARFGAVAACLLLVACAEDAVVAGPTLAADAVADACPTCGPCLGKPDGAACDDGQPCTGGDTCTGGACVAGASVCACQKDADCTDDGNACNGVSFCETKQFPYTCQPKPGSAVACPASGPCQTSACQPATGACLTVAAAVGAACDDGVPCTAAACDGLGACAATGPTCACATDADCAAQDDGNACNGVLGCTAAGACEVEAGTVVTCKASGVACLAHVCQPATGACVPTPLADGSACDDGKPCTTDGKCQGGACQAVAAPCACTADADCAAQDDGDLCNGVSFCNLAKGVCQANPASVVTCPTVDATACGQQACQPASGKCVWQPAGNGLACDDGNPCSAGDECQAGVCQGSPTCACTDTADCAAKEDGNACNGTLFCDKAAGKCAVNPASVVQCPTNADSACVKATCAPATGACALQPVADGSPCQDGNACTTGDACAKGGCSPGATLVCPCQKDSDCGKFEDGDLCNGTLFCDAPGADPHCLVNPATVKACATGLDTPCLQTACVAKSGLCIKILTPGACDDGNACTGPDGCVGGACAGGALSCDDGDACTQDACSAVLGGCSHVAKTCADGNPCTADACQPSGACSHAPVGGGCDDGSACTESDACQQGACQGLVLDCGDGNACTQDACAEGKGCSHLPLDATACDDGNACTGGDVCAKGTCVGKALPASACDDKAFCTIDACHPKAGCLHVPAPGLPCSDGDACTQGDACLDGACVGVPLAVTACDDGNACTQDGCGENGNGCSHVAVSGPCDDGKACTTGDACAGGLCLPAVVLPCACTASADCADDGDLCNGSLMCDTAKLPYACVVDPATVVACGKGDPCQPTACQPATGKCVASAKPEGAACVTGADACVAGACVGGACQAKGAVDCQDGNACTADWCDKTAGCLHEAAPLDGKACADGNACTAGETCAKGACQGGAPTACGDGNACTVDLCDPAQGCSHTGGLLDGKACATGDACVGGATCQGAACQGGKGVDCSDGLPCTVDLCDGAKGCLHDAAPMAGLPCDDGDACTGENVCKSAVCIGKTLDCDDGEACTQDACAPQTGCSHATASLEGKACVHPSGCVTGSACKAGSCVGGDPSGCGNLGNCAVQPDSLFLVQTASLGPSRFAFTAAGDGTALALSATGQLAALGLGHPVPAPWLPAYEVAAPTSVEHSVRPAVLALDDGGVLAGGGKATGGAGNLAWSRWIRRLDAKGAVVWSDLPAAAAAPVRDLVRLQDGSFAFAASSDPDGRATVARFQADGSSVWSRADKGASALVTKDVWRIERLIPHPDGGLYAIGSQDAPSASAAEQAWWLVARYSAGGSLQWSQTGSGGVLARWHDGVLHADGVLRVVGERKATATALATPWHARLSPAGVVLDQGAVLAGAAERVLDAVALAADGGAVVASHGRALATDALTHLQLHRLGSDGKAVWTRTWNDAGHLRPCIGCLAPAAGDGWRLGAEAWPAGQGPDKAAPVYLRTGAWGHSACAAAGVCGNKTLADCHDGVACTLDVCDAQAGCQHVATAALCDDGNICTTETCDAKKGCVVTPATGPCSLFGKCELAACTAGKCQVTGKLLDCDDGNACTIDGCSSATGCGHVDQATGSKCTDVAKCKQGLCSAKVCNNGLALDCNDGNPCTTDACTPVVGCTHKPIASGPCNDANACTTGETCSAGTCKGGVTKTCAAGQACTAGICHGTNCNNKGLTFVDVSGGSGLHRFVAYPEAWGYSPQGNPYVGDTDCATKLPLFCFRNMNYQPPTPFANWSGGEFRATAPVMGCGVTSQAVGDGLCAAAFGSGYVWFHWHVNGSESFGYATIAKGTRAWTLIKDQPNGNCWK